MNDDRREKLYNAITNISDAHIEEAHNTPLTKKNSNLKRIKRFAAVAAAFAVILFGVFSVYNRGLYENMNDAENEVFDSEFYDSDYTEEAVPQDSICDDALAGEGIQEEPEISENKASMSYFEPVLPMSFTEKNADITTVRDVTFDFVKHTSGAVEVIDSYILTNLSNTDKTITVRYPFVSETNNDMPTVTLNGRNLDTEIHTDALEERSYESGVLADVLAPVVEYILYIESDIVIPAGETVTISAEMVKNSDAGNKSDYNFDIVTNLNSNVKFTEQKVNIIENGNIEIVDQNFGFDLENGIKTVELDIFEEHYYLEVK